MRLTCLSKHRSVARRPNPSRPQSSLKVLSICIIQSPTLKVNFYLIYEVKHVGILCVYDDYIVLSFAMHLGYEPMVELYFYHLDITVCLIILSSDIHASFSLLLK